MTVLERFRELILERDVLQLLGTGDRHLVIAANGRDGRVISIRCSSGDIEVEELPSLAELGSDTLVVELPAPEAWAVGAGEALIEDLFEDGSLVLHNERPDDFRHGGAVLELVLEGLVQLGVLPGAEGQSCDG